MKKIMTTTLIPLGAALLLSGIAQAQTRLDPGKREFESNCASCHGLTGRGDGPVAKYLTTPPSNLTQLARRNGGVFPAQLVSTTVDGRSVSNVGPHGPRDMPVWGNVYRAEGMQPGDGDLRGELYTRARILELMDYLARIQEK